VLLFSGSRIKHPHRRKGEKRGEREGKSTRRKSQGRYKVDKRRNNQTGGLGPQVQGEGFSNTAGLIGGREIVGIKPKRNNSNLPHTITTGASPSLELIFKKRWRT